MTATVNAFPPLHAFNSSRGWFIALIVLLHAGFFWALTHGVTAYVFNPPKPQGPIKLVPLKQTPPEKPVVQPQSPTIQRIFVPTVEAPVLPPEEVTNGPIDVTQVPQPVPREIVVDKPGAGPFIVEPALDPRFPLTEPEYPVSEIRQGHEGTVLLSVQILPNGRVGDVRIDESSGYVKLDESAAKEAKRWRMRAGTSDGAAMAMWKRVPIKFQLKN